MLIVSVNTDKIMRELWQSGVSYKNVMVLKMRLEGMSNNKISQSILGTDDVGSITHHIKMIKKALNITSSGIASDIAMALICYERGYVSITEKRGP